MLDIVIASGNAGKIREISDMFGDLPVHWIPQKEVGTSPEVVEDGTTFRENALKKASAIAEWSGMPALAEDSGLQVDALDGAPGVYSARFAGEHATDAENVALLLRKLEGVPPEARTARFRAVMVLLLPEGELIEAEGVCEGSIATKPSGDAGFGYDPVFVPSGEQETFARLGLDVKNRMSHRAKALANLRPPLLRRLERSGGGV